ncbi:hypothetical protein BVRB_041950 [Beta vulgaris subsp. vulgaris]|uniref:Uncharacterized protein n=1 Tax=Beta vulgaris subsp. vulgaris TaxID=3555 RepID=A0A0J7YNZ9_BETVV|nr:hypothetical protein BVRB_041950 [Beta vulgaris subsp. vulgaris]
MMVEAVENRRGWLEAIGAIGDRRRRATRYGSIRIEFGEDGGVGGDDDDHRQTGSMQRKRHHHHARFESGKLIYPEVDRWAALQATSRTEYNTVTCTE